MGGINAVSTLAVLVLPGMYLLTRPGRRRWALGGWWVLAVLLATVWWAGPLLYQGRYGFNFLPYIEQAATTTQTMSAAAALRGSGNWVAYLNFGQPWLTAGSVMTESAWAVAAGAVAAAAGLAGLARRDLPEALWLRGTVGVAALYALAGYSGPLGGPLSPAGADAAGRAAGGAAQRLQDRAGAGRGAGARDRACAGPRRVAAAGRARGRLRGRGGHPGRPGPALPERAGAAAGVLHRRCPPTGSRRPTGWARTTAPRPPWWCRPTRMASTPGDSRSTSRWNRWPAHRGWSGAWCRSAAAGSSDLLNGAEQAIEAGTASPGLAGYLARAGIRYVLVRNDLDPAQLGYTPPEVVHAALRASGFTRVASFGQPAPAGPVGQGTSLQVEAIEPEYPPVEIFQAADPADRPGGPAAVLPAASTTLVDGGPAALLQLTGQGLLGTGQPAVIAGQDTAADPPAARQVVTDGLRRADTAFGLPDDNTSYPYTATGTIPPDDPQGAGGEPPRQLLPAGTAGHQTVAVLTGAASVTASSAGSWLWEVPQGDPGERLRRQPGHRLDRGQPGQRRRAVDPDQFRPPPATCPGKPPSGCSTTSRGRSPPAWSSPPPPGARSPAPG